MILFLELLIAILQRIVNNLKPKARYITIINRHGISYEIEITNGKITGLNK